MRLTTEAIRETLAQHTPRDKPKPDVSAPTVSAESGIF